MFPLMNYLLILLLKDLYQCVSGFSVYAMSEIVIRSAYDSHSWVNDDKETIEIKLKS